MGNLKVGRRPAGPSSSVDRAPPRATAKTRAPQRPPVPVAAPATSGGKRLTGESARFTPLRSLDLGSASASPAAEKLLGSLKGLPAVEVRQLEAIATGKNPLSVRAREALAPLLAKPSYQQASAEVRAAQVRAVFNKSVAEVVSVDAPELQKGQRSSAGRVAAPVAVANFDFEVVGFSRKQPAQRFDVTVNGRTVPVYGPADGTFSTARGATKMISHTPEEIARALSMLRPEDLALVKDVRLSPVPNPEDSMWARIYKEKGFSSYMNAGAEGQITVFPWAPEKADEYSSRSLAANLGHELGHVASNGKWGPGRGQGRKQEWTQWQAAQKADGVVASVYARASVEEDLAETDALRKLAVGTPFASEFRALFPNRIAILDQHFPLGT